MIVAIKHQGSYHLSSKHNAEVVRYVVRLNKNSINQKKKSLQTNVRRI